MQIQCLIVLIYCSSGLTRASKDDQVANKPKFSDFHDLKLNKIDEKKNENKSNEAHSRQKRLIWITDDGRLALPPGTALTITPSLTLPFVRYPPDGFFSNISLSLPVTSEIFIKFYCKYLPE